VTCPSNVTDNTALAIGFGGTGCNNTNNVGGEAFII
jgi:hypothetical protein